MVRGDVFALRAPRRARGAEQTGRRYGVVVQATDLLELSTVIVAPTSPRALPASFHPTVGVGGEPTQVLVEQLGAVDPGRLGEQVGRVTWSELETIDEALHAVLGL